MITVVTSAEDLVVIDSGMRWTANPKNIENVLAEINDKIGGSLFVTRLCSIAVGQFDWVYSSASNTVDLANAGNPLKMPILGVVLSKPSPNTAVILKGIGTVTGWPVPLVPQQFYYMGATDGQMSTTPPVTPGSALQRLAQAATATILDVNIEEEKLIA